MASTALPFLYQTRTIQRVSRVATTHIVPRSLLYTTPKQCFSSRPKPGQAPAPVIGPDHAIPFELPPDLAADPRFNPPPLESTVDVVETPGLGTITPKERSAFDKIFHEIAHHSGYTPLSLPRENDGSGLPTDQELRRMTQVRSSAYSRELVDTILSDALLPKSRKSKKMIRDIRQLGEIAIDRGDEFSTTGAEVQYERLLSFPPSLRAAARRAFGILESSDQSRSPGSGEVPREIFADHMPLDAQRYLASSGESMGAGVQEQKDAAQTIDELLPLSFSLPSLDESEPSSSAAQHQAANQDDAEQVRSRERVRVAKLMLQAQSDFELWEIMEREVFSMLSRLGVATSKAKPNRRSRSKRSELEGVTPTRGDSPKLDMLVHGPLYSTHILSALLVMLKHFPASPLALSVLPRIKSLGVVSYILGASTDIYTALMKLHWGCYRDPRAVVDLMDEMARADLLFELKHMRLLEDVERSMRACVEGKRGGFLQGIVTMPEWAHLLTTRIPKLKDLMALSLQVREVLPEEVTPIRKEDMDMAAVDQEQAAPAI